LATSRPFSSVIATALTLWKNIYVCVS
jgi:hypothetical protein